MNCSGNQNEVSALAEVPYAPNAAADNINYQQSRLTHLLF